MAEAQPVTVADIIESKRRRRLQTRLQFIGYAIVFLAFVGTRTYDTKKLGDYTLCNENRRNAYLAADLRWKRALGNGEIDLDARRITIPQYHQVRLNAYRDIFKFLDGAKNKHC